MFAIIQSILVYGIMVWIMTYNAKRLLVTNCIPTTFKQFITNKNILVPLIIFSIFAAIRWRVGADCTSYIFMFYRTASETELSKGEILFYGIMNFFKYLNATHIPFFFTLAFIQLGFIYYGLRKNPKMLWFFPLMFVLYGTYWMYMNGVRQCLACSIFIFVTLLLSEKKFIWAILWIFIATLFHRSAYTLFIIGTIFYFTRNIFINRNIQLIILAGCYAMMGMSVGDQLGNIATDMLDFAGYEEDSQEHLLEAIFEINFGIRAFLSLAANIVVIFFSKNIRRFYNSQHFNLMYNIYFVGLCTWVLFYGNHGIERFNMYFTCFIPIMLSAAVYYFYKNWKKQICRLSLLIIISMLFFRTFYEMYDSANSALDLVNYKSVFNNFNFNLIY